MRKPKLQYKLVINMHRTETKMIMKNKDNAVKR